MRGLVGAIGSKTIEIISKVGNFSLFLSESFRFGRLSSFPLKNLLEQLMNMAVRSLPLIAITAIFTGAVLAFQSYTGLSRMHAGSSIASIVAISISRELGPVLSGLMFAGRLGASITAEIGTMKVTEQLDAFEILGVGTKSNIILPRILGGVIAMPILVIFADIVGLFGGYLVATYSLGFESTLYIKNTISFLRFHDVMSGLVKAVFFGFAVCAFGCYSGYRTSKGAAGVGVATTQSVVTSSIAIIFLNCLITNLMFNK